MRALFHESTSTNFDGYINAVSARGDSVVVWHPDIKPTFDLFHEYQPEVVIISSDNLTADILRCCRQYTPLVKVFVNAWCSTPDPFVQKAFPLERKLVKELPLEYTSLFTIYDDSWMAKWHENGVQPTKLPIGVDSIMYAKIEAREVYRTGTSVIENNPGLEYDAIYNMRKYGKLKLYGEGWGDYPEGVGLIAKQEIGNVIASSDEVCTFNPYSGIAQIRDWYKGAPVPTYAELLENICPS